MVPTEDSSDQSKIHGLLFKFTSHVKQFFGVIGSGQTGTTDNWLGIGSPHW